MADERPLFLFLGEGVADGLAPARTVGSLVSGDAQLFQNGKFPRNRRDEDVLRALRTARYDWYQRHADALGVDLRPTIYNHVGLQRAISTIADNGDGTSRVYAPAAGSASSYDTVVTVRGVVVTSGADPNGWHYGTRVDNDNWDIPGEFDDAGHAFASSLVTASGGRGITITREDAPPSPLGSGIGRHYIEATSGDFLADGFRPGQLLTVAGTSAGAFNARTDYWLEEVTATRLYIREQGSAGFHTTVAGITSNLTLQAFAQIGEQSFDTYLNPFAPFASNPNGVTEFVPPAVGMYPSNEHGVEAAFVVDALDDDTPPTDDSAAPYVCKLRGDLTGGRLAASMADGSKPIKVATYTITANTSVQLNLDRAHGWTGTERVYVSVGGAGFESLSDWYTATVVDADSVSVPIEVPDPSTLDPMTVQEQSRVFGVDSITFDAENSKTLLDLFVDLLNPNVHGWSGTVYVHVEMGPGFEELTGYHLATVESDSQISIPVYPADPAALPDTSAEPFYGRNLGTVAARDLVPSVVTAVADGTEIKTTRDHGLTVGDWLLLGNLTSAVPITGAHQVLEVVDDDTFRIGVIVDTPTDVGDAWIARGRRWSDAYRTQTGTTTPHNGGSALEHARLLLRNLFGAISRASPAVTTHLAGLFTAFGRDEDVATDPGLPATDLPKSSQKIDRFWLSYANLAKQIREHCAALGVEFGFPITNAADPSQIPWVAVNYSPDQSQQLVTVNGIPVLKSPVTNRYVASAWLIREQTQLALGAAGGRLGMVDPYQEGMTLQADGLTWTGETMLQVGSRCYDVWSSIMAGTAVDPTDDAPLGVPVYFLIGQSQTQGWIEAAWLYLDRDPNYNGNWIDAQTGAILRERQTYIWNHTSHQFEELKPTVGGAPGNTNTHPTQNTLGAPLFGPEVSLIMMLRERHPEGVYLIKLARHAASIQNIPLIPSWDPDAGDLYADLLYSWDRARRWLCEQGKVPDVRGFVYDQGEGDAFEEWYDSYPAALDKLIDRIRQDFQTRVDEDLPVIIGRLMDHDRQVFHRPAVDLVRATQDAKAASDPNIVAVDMDSVAIIDDDVHRSGRGAIRAGLLLGEGFDGSLANYNHPRVIDYELDPFDDGSSGSTGSGETAESLSATASAGGGTVSTAAVDQVSSGATIEITGSSQLEIATQIVAACDAAILAGLEVLSYSVNGRTVTRNSLRDIQALRMYYAQVISKSQGWRRTQASFD